MLTTRFACESGTTHRSFPLPGCFPECWPAVFDDFQPRCKTLPIRPARNIFRRRYRSSEFPGRRLLVFAVQLAGFPGHNYRPTPLCAQNHSGKKSRTKNGSSIGSNWYGIGPRSHRQIPAKQRRYPPVEPWIDSHFSRGNNPGSTASLIQAIHRAESTENQHIRSMTCTPDPRVPHRRKVQHRRAIPDRIPAGLHDRIRPA